MGPTGGGAARRAVVLAGGSPAGAIPRGSCWIPGSYTPCTGLKHLILNGFFQRCRIGHDPRGKPVKTTCYAKLDQLRPLESNMSLGQMRVEAAFATIRAIEGHHPKLSGACYTP